MIILKVKIRILLRRNAAANWENRAFFRRKQMQRDGSVEPGSYGSVAFNRCLLAWEEMNQLTVRNEQPWDSDEEGVAERERDEADGTFVGFLPNDISDIITTVKRQYKKFVEEQASVCSDTSDGPIGGIKSKAEHKTIFVPDISVGET